MNHDSAWCLCLYSWIFLVHCLIEWELLKIIIGGNMTMCAAVTTMLFFKFISNSIFDVTWHRISFMFRNEFQGSKLIAQHQEARSAIGKWHSWQEFDLFYFFNRNPIGSTWKFFLCRNLVNWIKSDFIHRLKKKKKNAVNCCVGSRKSSISSNGSLFKAVRNGWILFS